MRALFTARHYNLLAEKIVGMEYTSGKLEASLMLADVFRRDNPNFKLGQWFKECRLESYEDTYRANSALRTKEAP